MKNKNGNLERAVRKIKRHDVRQFCGYLTPSEIVAVMDNGGVIDAFNRSWVDYAQNKKDDGVGNPTWFYFTIRTNSNLAKLLGDKITDQAHNKG